MPEADRFSRLTEALSAQLAQARDARILKGRFVRQIRNALRAARFHQGEAELAADLRGFVSGDARSYFILGDLATMALPNMPSFTVPELLKEAIREVLGIGASSPEPKIDTDMGGGKGGNSARNSVTVPKTRSAEVISLTREDAVARIAASLDPDHMLTAGENKRAAQYAERSTAIFEVSYWEGTLPIGVKLDGRAIVKMQQRSCWFPGEERQMFVPHRYVFTKTSLEAHVEQKVIIFVM